MVDPISVLSSNLRILRAFDVGDAIDLEAAVRALGEGVPTRFLVGAAGKQGGIVLRHPPITIPLGEVPLPSVGLVSAVARVWDFGVVSIALRCPMPPDLPFSRLATETVARATDPAVDRVAHEATAQLVARLGDAVSGPSPLRSGDRYFALVIERGDGLGDARALLAHPSLPAVLLGETDPRIADDTKRAALEHAYQYRPDDLVVLDVEGAVIVEPSASEDLPDLLELALTYLLEVDYYDEVVTHRMRELYRALGARSGSLGSPRARSHQASRIYLELAELLERLDGSLEIVGDAYLARVFRGAVQRFHVADRKASIDRRMHALGQVSELLKAEAEQRRSWALEWIIIGLIAFEIVLTLVEWARA